MSNTIQIGSRFERWTVLSVAPKEYGNHKVYLCKCDCGTERTVVGSSLRTGRSKSCGCLNREAIAISNNKVHCEDIYHKHPLYIIWRGIKQRLFDKRHDAYKYYGGRGITMHPEWINDFKTFAQYIDTNLGERQPEMTLDRINNNSHYEPNNLRWATRKQQLENRNINQ